MVQKSTKQVIVASLSSFLTAAAIVASGCGKELWTNYFNTHGGTVTDADFGILSGLSANCFSAAIGAIVGGLLADRYGRKNVFSFSMLLFLLGIGVTATSTSFAQLATGVFLTGLAAGATVSSSWTYIAEVSEPEHRGRNIAISQLAWGIGAAGVLWLSTANAPGSYMYGFVKWAACDVYGLTWNESNPGQVSVFGIRLIFGVIYLIALVTWVLQRQIPESEEFTREAEEHQGKGTGIMHSFVHVMGPKYRRALNAITWMYLLWNLVASLMGSFQPHIYETAGNLPQEVADRFNVWQWVLTCLLTFWGIFILDKWSHKKLFLYFSSCGILAWLLVVIFGIGNIPMLILITILWGAQAGISVQLFFALWGTEVFPTKYRATAMGMMFCVVRAVCTVTNVGFSSLWGDPTLVTHTMFTISAAFMLVILVISAVIGYRYAPDTAGKSLEDISNERYGNK